MGWRSTLTIFALALVVGCGSDPPGVGPEEDGAVEDVGSADLDPAQIELVEGHVPTLGGIVAGSGGATPAYKIEDDGLEYMGTQGTQCSTDKQMCVTEGGIVP